MLKRIVLLSGFTGMLMVLQAQDNVMIPQTGKHYPNPAVLFVEKENGSELISLPAYKGTPMIVDFFASTCAVCFKSLPKINGLQQDFKGKMKFLLVGKEDKHIRRNYESFKKRFNLKLDIAYDSMLHRSFGEITYPLYVWIDGDGIVQAVTGVDELVSGNIERFIEGKSVTMMTPPERSDVDLSKPYMVNGNGGDDSVFLSRTLFTIWRNGNPIAHPFVINYKEYRDSLQLLGLTMTQLYQFAYFGQIEWKPGNPLYGDAFPFPVFEDGSFLTRKKFPSLYCYSLWLSPAQTLFTNLQERFQADLEFQFGYAASIEYRLIPYHRLTVRDGFAEKLRSVKSKRLRTDSHGSLLLEYGTIKDLVRSLVSRMPEEMPFIDDTGITYPIDIRIDAVMSDLASVRQALYEVGLHISPAVKPMRVLVLRKKSGNVAAN